MSPKGDRVGGACGVWGRAPRKLFRAFLAIEHLGLTGEEMNEMVREIYDKTERDLAEKEAQLDHVQARLDSLTRLVESLVVNPDVPSFRRENKHQRRLRPGAPLKRRE